MTPKSSDIEFVNHKISERQWTPSSLKPQLRSQNTFGGSLQDKSCHKPFWLSGLPWTRWWPLGLSRQSMGLRFSPWGLRFSPWVFVLVHGVFVLFHGVLGLRSSFLGLPFSNTPWNSLTSTFLAFANEAGWRNLDTFDEQKNSFPSTRRFFLDNREAGRAEIILKMRDKI